MTGAGRIVHHGDALPWLREHAPLAGASVITSLPDVSELPRLGFAGWARWFSETAALVIGAVPPDGVAIFFQSDIRHEGAWIDKAAMVSRAAAGAGARMLFHKIVCRKPPGTATLGRATYAHLLAFSRSATPPRAPRRPTPDVLPDGGPVPGRKAMGVGACLLACRFVLEETPTRTVIDPFCGWGTTLAVANALGMPAIGVELSARMCRRARALRATVEGDEARLVGAD